MFQLRRQGAPVRMSERSEGTKRQEEAQVSTVRETIDRNETHPHNPLPSPAGRIKCLSERRSCH